MPLITQNPYSELDKRFDVDKVFTIRTSGSVHLYGPEVAIVDTAEFQRLGEIKQLGTSYFVFRAAVHTRFEHALGAVHAAQRIVEKVNRNKHSERHVESREVRLIRLFALLHDLPHVPFGHTLEDEFGLLVRHDENAERINVLLWDSPIGEILRDALPEDDYEVFRRMINAKTDEEIAALGRDAFAVDIVANTVCADAIDYVQRDLEACGMPVELGERFLDFFIITNEHEPKPENRHRMALVLDKRGMPRPDVESEVVKLLTYRYELAERVYFHHAKNAASVMIGRAVQALGLHEDDANFRALSDDMLLSVIRNPPLAEPLGLTLNPAEGGQELAMHLGSLLRKRELFKIAYLGIADDFGALRDSIFDRHGAPEDRLALEDSLAARAGVPVGYVLVHLLRPNMAEKLADVRVKTTDGGAVVSLQKWDAAHNGRILALNEAHRRLWRITVYANPALTAEQLRLVQLAAEEVFKRPTRYVKQIGEGRYLLEVFDQSAPARGWTLFDREAVLATAARGETREPQTLEDALELVAGQVEAARAIRDNTTDA